ncbi:methyltransferase domain-containing protein [Sutcliffiella horikoshii]|uniref:class I SAM-dependent methyltransferase n=1 Tax=Sutcliffiella horikoshii TaxID=79883 RepID=UPI00203CDF76|nr:class I SAM-dependent methyltransferase [Sutcliffiella horikoshii]MCM3617763.1 methyltransferase domain-containing protein [Sutcliffiella horikoshii]
MNQLLDSNRKSWNKVAHYFSGVDALPSYGPFAQTEDELKLLDDLKNKKVLDIGYGSGHSLKYMAEEKGASELWGVDLSSEQKSIAEKTLQKLEPRLFCAPMEQDIDLPKEYFDCVYSIYALGWTTDLKTTLSLIHSYLKKGGSFLFSWDHPLYAHIKSEGGVMTLEGSYQEEGLQTFEKFKGEDAPMTIHTRKIATYINELIQAGFTIEKVVESEVGIRFEEEDAPVSDRYYSLYKTRKFPSTLIIKARK